ncbi:papain-like cysteine protease family protein [Actinokineospora inagensis]|uniref:papain-like cysteine protease family protein n=1 Tax=Actinokineospora inagensis TaxID=103730 RepID=UPI0004239EF6|nr:papain-like cysteine protease family protein [Actinokineospora inagensis]
MDRQILRRGVLAVPTVALAMVCVVSPAVADSSLPNGLIKTGDHIGVVKEIVPTRAAMTAPMVAKKLTYTQQVQQQDNWCWAATGASIERSLGGTATQRTFCAAGKGAQPGYCPNEGAEIPEIVRGFQGTGFQAQDAGGTVSYATIVGQIDAGSPSLTGIYWTSGGGHAEVIYGYDQANKTILLGDPWPSYQRYQTWAYNRYLSNAQFQWGDTIVNITKG